MYKTNDYTGWCQINPLQILRLRDRECLTAVWRASGVSSFHDWVLFQLWDRKIKKVFTWHYKQAGCGWLKSWHLMMCNLSALLNEFLPNINWHMHYHSWLVSHHCIETSTICVPSLYFRGTLKNDQQMACTSFGSLGQPQFYNAQCNIAQQYRCRGVLKRESENER